MKNPYWNKTFGDKGEDQACAYLEKLRYRILERNVRTFWGEIDVIALDQSTLVFVEVKRRMDVQFGEPEEALTPGKRKHIVKAAISYLQRGHEMERPMRFDVISIGPKGLQHFVDAFQAYECF